MEKTACEKMVRLISKHPYHRFIGMKIEASGDGEARVAFSVSDHILNNFGAVHGGYFYTVCDVAAFVAAMTLVPDGYIAVTSDINVSVMSPVHSGDLITSAKVLKLGKRTCFIESRIECEGRLIAVARITKSVVPFPGMRELTA